MVDIYLFSISILGRNGLSYSPTILLSNERRSHVDRGTKRLFRGLPGVFFLVVDADLVTEVMTTVRVFYFSITTCIPVKFWVGCWVPHIPCAKFYKTTISFQFCIIHYQISPKKQIFIYFWEKSG